MQAIRLVRPQAHLCSRRLARSLSAAAHTSPVATSPSPSNAVIPLSNVEAQWEKLTAEEQLTVHQQLEEIQKKDWKTLSLDEKKAAYYVAFGPHGPRADLHPPGSVPKIIAATFAMVAAGGVLYGLARYFGGDAKTMTKEWQEASNERAVEMKINPISGISSEGYSGKGFVTKK